MNKGGERPWLDSDDKCTMTATMINSPLLTPPHPSTGEVRNRRKRALAAVIVLCGGWGGCMHTAAEVTASEKLPNTKQHP